MTNEIVQKRQKIERRIATAFIKSALAKGYSFKIDNGGDESETIKTTALQETLNAMFATDQEHLYICKDGKAIGWAFFVYGNDGWDVISDYTCNLDDLGVMTEATELAYKLSA